MTPERLSEIRVRHERGHSLLSDSAAVVHTDRGELLAEVDRLREGILRYRIAQGHHMAKSWADHFDELAAPDPIWKTLNDQRAARLRIL